MKPKSLKELKDILDGLTEDQLENRVIYFYSDDTSYITVYGIGLDGDGDLLVSSDLW